MRKIVISLMMASALVPAAASARDRDGSGDRIRARAERTSDDNASSRDQRPARVMRAERPERPARVERVERPDRSERIARESQTEAPVRQVQQVEQVQQVREAAPVQRVRRGDRSGGNLVDAFRATARENETRKIEDRRGDRHDRWSSDWRRDHRYDWRHYRDRNRSLFRFGHYYDPYGWGYRRWSIGFSLWPSYYGSSFWLNDPWMYRLPPVYGPYRWVRYYDDALLVNIYTGQVVDVIYGFFW